MESPREQQSTSLNSMPFIENTISIHLLCDCVLNPAKSILTSLFFNCEEVISTQWCHPNSRNYNETSVSHLSVQVLKFWQLGIVTDSFANGIWFVF